MHDKCQYNKVHVFAVSDHSSVTEQETHKVHSQTIHPTDLFGTALLHVLFCPSRLLLCFEQKNANLDCEGNGED